MLPQKFSAGQLAVLSSTRRCDVWQVCFIVFVSPTAIFVALGLLEILILGGEGNDPGRESGQDPQA
jgi:hypothetical protein